MAQKKKVNKHSGSAFGILLGGVALAAVVYFVFDYNYFMDLIVARNYTPSAQMQTLIDDVALTKNGNRIMRASLPVLQNADDFNRNCGDMEEDTASLGCYVDGKIYIYDIENDELKGIKQAVLAHELLHAVWKRTSVIERNRLGVYLDDVYNEHLDSLSEHMKYYPEDSYLDELHSIIGTQVALDEMPQALAQHYEKYLENQGKIVEYYNTYSNRFAEIQTRLEELSAEIQKMRSEIDRETESYNKKYNQLESEIIAFNNRVNRGLGTLDEYQELNSRKLALREEYDELNAKVDKVNELIAEYNKNYVHAGELYESIDSNAAGAIDTPDAVK